MADQRNGDAGPSGAARALIIEDEPVIAADIQSTLIEGGYAVVGLVGTEREAVKAFERHRPDFVMVDLQLADGSSGIDAIQAMQDIADVPMIVVTAFPERLLTAERPKPAYLITKPFRPETLLAAVDHVLGQAGSRVPPSAAGRALATAVSSAVLALERVEPAAPEELSDVGARHNQSPSGGALTADEVQAVDETLQDLLAANARGPIDPGKLAAAEAMVDAASRKITAWVAERLAQIEEGFFRQVGASLADWKFLVAAWLLLSGKLDAVVAAIRTLAGGGG